VTFMNALRLELEGLNYHVERHAAELGLQIGALGHARRDDELSRLTFEAGVLIGFISLNRCHLHQGANPASVAIIAAGGAAPT